MQRHFARGEGRLSVYNVSIVAVSICVMAAPSNADSSLRRVAAVLGLTPTSLTVSGLAVSDVTVLFASLRGSAELAAVLAAQQSLSNAEDALRAALRIHDPFAPAGAEAIEQATSARDSAKASFAAAAEAAVARATLALTTEQRRRLAAWRASPHSLHSSLRIAAWSAAEVRALEEALLEERLAGSSQSTVSPQTADLLAQARARLEVVDAATRLEANLAAVRNAYLEATQ
jgi:hypothetical protein